MRWTRWWLPTLSVLLVACGAPTDSEQAASSTADLPFALVESVATQHAVIRDGVVESVQQTTLSAQTTARVTALPFDVNDEVKKGDLLVQLTDTEQQAAVRLAMAQQAQAKAALVEAEAAYERIQSVYAKGLTSSAQLDSSKSMRDQAKAGVAAAEAQLAQAKRQLEYTHVIAPFDGVIRQRFVEVGQAVQSGPPMPQPLIELQQASLRVQLVLAESEADKLRQTPHVSVQSSAGQWVQAEKITVFPYADPQTHSVTVRATLPDDATSFYPGMSVKVNMITDNRQPLFVPMSAIVKRGELVGVYVLTDNRALLRQVRIGNQQDDKVEVLSGLSQGEKVAIDPQATLVWLIAQRDNK